MKSPFKFLDSYTLDDRDIFFGRDREIEELYQRVFDSKLLLVYGVSGTGKSSLIHCGLANKFRETDWLPVVIRRGLNIIESLAAGIRAASITPQKIKFSGAADFKRGVRSLYLDHYKPVFFIFDQFEELFIFGDKEERKSFVQIIKSLIDSDLQCRLIFVMREEYMAGVTEFEKYIPTFFANRVRIEKMSHIHALEAIIEPCKVFNISLDDGFAETLLEKLSPGSTEVELTYLQVFLDKIFRLARSDQQTLKDQEKISFTIALLNKFGNVSDLLGSFLDEQISLLDDPDTGLAVLKSFVSVKGTKRQITSEEVNEYAHTLGKPVEDSVLIEMLQTFVNIRILIDKDQNGRYELRHDALATKIYEKITLVEKEILEIRQFIENAFSAYEKRGKLLTSDDLKYISLYEDKLYLSKPLGAFVNKSKNDLHRSRIRRRNISTAAAIALIIVLSGFTVWALSEKRKSNLNYLRAKANSYNFLSQKVVETDPTSAMRLAEYAYSIDSFNQDIVENLRRIYYDNNFYKTFSRTKVTIYSTAFSPDDKYILMGSNDYTARLYDLMGNVLMVFKGHQNGISSVTFSPDGKSILTGSWDKTARLWDLKGNILQVFEGHENSVNSVAFSPDGKSILTGSQDNTARHWDLHGNILQVFKGHERGISSVAFSPDGKFILTGSEDNTARLWNLNGNVLQVFKGHERAITSVAFSPDGKRFLTASWDNSVRIWDPQGNVLQVFKPREYSIYSIAFSPDGKTMLAGSSDNTTYLLDLQGNLIMKLKGHKEPVNCVAFSHDDKYVITSSYDGRTLLWKLTGSGVKIIKSHPVASVSFSPDGKGILSGSYDSTACIRDLEGNILQILRGHTGCVFSAVFSPDGKNILTGSFDKTARLWDLQGKVLQIFKGHQDNIFSVAFSPDRKTILTGSMDKTARLWDLQGNTLRVFKGHSDGIIAVAFSPDGKSVITSSADNTAILWDLNGTKRIVISGTGESCSIAFSPDGKTILTGGNNKNAQLWDLQGNLLQIFKGASSEISCVAFSPDGKTVMACSYDFITRIWDLDGNELQDFKGHVMDIYSIAVSPDGKSLVSGSKDQTIRLYEIKKTLKEYQIEDVYEKLSETQKIEFGISDYSDILKLNDEKSVYEAAEYYYDAINSVGRDKKNEYINNALNLFSELKIRYKNARYITGLLDVYELMQETTPSGEISDKIDGLNSELMSKKNSEGLLTGAEYFYTKGYASSDNIKKVSYYQKSVLLYDNIRKEFPENEVKEATATLYNNISLALLFTRQYGDALIYAQKGADLINDDIRNTKLALAYLFNNKYDEALKIIETRKNSSVNDVTFKEYILTKLNELENEDITNADAKKLKEVLQR